MEWKEVRLESILALPSRNGLTKPSKIRGKGVKMIGMGELFANPIIYDIPMDRVPVTDKELSNSRIMPGDLLFARQSLTLEGAGKCCYVKEVKEETVFESHLIRIRIDNTKADAEFIYYFFNSFIGKCLIQNLVTQVAAAGIRGSELVKLDITIPKEVEDQRRIASILSSLDRKIELNNKINADLEEMAQAIFKNWFVDFEPFKDGKFVDSELGMIPEGWKVGTLFDIAEIFDKKRKPLSGNVREKMDKIYPYYGATSCMDYVDDYIFDGIYTLIGEDGSVVKENGLPYMQYVWGKMWVNNHAHILQGKNGYSTEMIHALLSITNIKFLVTGAVQAKLSQGNMQKILVAIPPKNVLDEIRPVIDNLYSKIRINTDENSRLSLLRDTLLPRLMSGEIEIP